ncbi:MAG: ABC transporter permease [Lentisphaeria bacterium]
MKIHRTLFTALRALRRNPMRALLTTLGIVIGVAAVIAMMEIGRGSSESIRSSISSMGANNIMIRPGTVTASGVSFGSGSIKTLVPADCEAILRECPAVRCVTPLIQARAQLVYGSRNWVPSSIYGASETFLDVRDWTELSEGEPFTEHDVRTANRVCLLGQTIARELFQGESPLGKEIRVKNVPFRVIGVLSPKGANMFGMDQDDILVAPWTSIKYRLSGSSMSMVNQSATTASSSRSPGDLYSASSASLYPAASSNSTLSVRFANIDQIYASAVSSAAIPDAISQIASVLRERHRLQPGQPDDFQIGNMTEMLKVLTSTTALMTNLLLCVAFISLVVGGVGIMNIMLVSVTERTREIGLRMAVGARARDILRQFLIESVVLCLAGGAIGILLGHGGSLLVKQVLKWPVATSPGAILAAVAVSATVGVVFGFYPAWKASRMDPIEALRYE